MVTIPVQIPRQPAAYDVLIEPHLLHRLGEVLKARIRCERTVIITDVNVARWYLPIVENSLHAHGMHTIPIVVPAGEDHKTLDTVRWIYETMLDRGTDRSCAVIALGGGVIGDMSGFVAATYMRGLPLVQVPTTLLAQVDAAIGGKTGVNLPRGKNLVGAFYQPILVAVDPETLDTLPDRIYMAAFGEVIKYGCIQDPALLDMLERQWSRIRTRDPDFLAEIIARCVTVKAAVVQADEYDTGRRQILNFGHTIGHALEAATAYTVYQHGEAILWGMWAAGWLSVQKGYLSPEELGAIEHWIERIPKPTLRRFKVDQLWYHIAVDKKVRDQTLHFILVGPIGRARVEPVTETEVRAAITALLERFVE